MKIKSLIITLLLVLISVSSFLPAILVSADTVTYPAASGVNCPIGYGQVSGTCQPPTISDLQVTIVTVIGTMYGLVGLIFTGILVFNGMVFLIGYWEEAKYILGFSIEDSKKLMTQWMIGLLIVIIAYPIMNTLMKGIVGTTSNCYDKLNSPAFQFVFPTVCTKSPGVITPTPTPTASP
jgi:hypothetical protein